MDSLFGAEVIAVYAFSAKYLIDWIEELGIKNSIAKRAISVVLGIAFAFAMDIDILSRISENADPTIIGYLITGLVLSASSSVLAHPAIEAIKNAGRDKRQQDN